MVLKQQQKWSLSICILIVVIVLSNSPAVLGNTGITMAAERITLTVNFGNGTIMEFNDLNGSTVLDVTTSVLDVNIQWFGSLAYVKGIEGLTGEGEYGWQYWVNGEFASIAANLYSLKNGDNVTWVYSTPIHNQQIEDPSFIPGVIIVAAAGLGFIVLVYVNTRRRIR